MPVFAQEEIRELASLKLEYDVKVERLRAPIAKLAAKYKEKLRELKARFQESGDLNGVLEVSREIDTIDETGAPTGNPPADSKLANVRKIYDDAKSKIEAGMAGKFNKLNASHRAKLETLQGRLTKERRLDDAIAVRDYAKTIVDIPEPGQERREPGGKLRVRVQVDERSLMYLCGDEIWFDHRGGKGGAPGLHRGIPVPTELNGKKWMPVWNKDITISKKHDAKIGLPQWNVELKCKQLKGRGHVVIAGQPSRKNRYTAKIELHDMSADGTWHSGPDFLEFELSW